MKKRLVTILALLCVLIMVLAGCGSTESEADSESSSSTTSDSTEVAESDIRIAFLAQANNTFQAALTEAAKAKADELGVVLDAFNADNDITKQLDQIESAIASKYDAILISAVDSNGITPGTKAAMEAGIPVICVNMLVEDESAYDVYVGSDDVDAGRIQGEWLKEATGGVAKIGLLYVPIGCSAEVGRTKGLKESFLDVCPDAVVVAEDDGKAQIDEGMRITEDWLQTYPEIDTIIAQNDSMALGAMQAVLAAGKKDDIIICGVDGDQAAVQAIIDGTFDMTVFQNSKGQASMGVEVAVGMINGESYDKSVIIPFEAITADNAEDYLN